jgi:hypothetical protein
MTPMTTQKPALSRLSLQIGTVLKKRLALIIVLISISGLLLVIHGQIETALQRRDATADRVRLLSAKTELMKQGQAERAGFVDEMRKAALIHPLARQDDVIRKLREDLGLILGPVRLDVTLVPGRVIDVSNPSMEPTSAGIRLLPVKLQITTPETGWFGIVKAIEELRPGILVETLSIRPRQIRGKPNPEEEPQIEIMIDAVLLVETAVKAGSS